jgi:hypothetical protein
MKNGQCFFVDLYDGLSYSKEASGPSQEHVALERKKTFLHIFFFGASFACPGSGNRKIGSGTDVDLKFLLLPGFILGDDGEDGEGDDDKQHSLTEDQQIVPVVQNLKKPHLSANLLEKVDAKNFAKNNFPLFRQK